MKNNQKKIKKSFFAAFALILIFAIGVTTAAAETSVVWSKNIGDVTAADMSEDGSVIYAAVGSQVFVYDSAGVQQNTFTVGGNVVKLVCTADGSKAALYTDTYSVYFINNGAITWSESFSAITDIDISNAGSVLIVEGTIFHKYLYDGSLEYDSSSGIYNLGVIDPNDEFAIVGSSGNVLQKYILSTSDQYWAKVGDNTFNTAFQDFQNLLILYTNPDQTEAIILSNATLGKELWEQVSNYIAVSDSSLNTTGAYNYLDTLGVVWTEQTASAGWSTRGYASSWVVGDKLFIGGGYSSSVLNDVWMSEDSGVTWTQQTASAGWSARYGACCWVVGDKLFIGGGYSGSNLNDVWVSEESLQIQPSSTGQTFVFYNYTGASPSHTQTTYNNAVDFSGTYELRTKPTLSIYSLQTTKTLTGNISALSLSDRGDWLGTATVSRIYHDQITSSGFGTDYNAALGSTGTVYDVATANAASMSIAGQGQITDIYSQTASRVGTYTAGGAVTHVDIADKNALWATSGGEDGKVYIFSKDASSNWYLEYSSDSEGSVTALSMSSRGEFVLAGRTGSLTLYQTNTPQQTTTDFWLTLYVYKDSDSYRNAAVNVSVYTNNQWTSFAQGLTDSAGKYVVLVTAGQNYKFDIDNGQKLIIYQASPSVTSLTASIYSTPISSSLTYEAEWDPETNSITFDYHDSAGQTQSVTVRILRTDNWDVVYENTFTNQQSIEQNLPMIDDTVTYKVEMSAQRVSGLTRNTFFVSSSRDIVSIPLDQNLKNILFTCFLIFIAGLFSYYSAVRGPIVVAFMAVLFVYMGWLTIPWYWVTVAVVIAILAAFTQRR